MPEFIQDLKLILEAHSPLISIKNSLHVLFSRTPYSCEKAYPVAIVHEERRIKEASALAYFKDNLLLDNGQTYEEYPEDDLESMAEYAPKYIQTVGFMLFADKELSSPSFSSKFKHDFWKKLVSVKGLEAVIDISILTATTSTCEAENTLRGIIRKRKEVHQLKKISFVWIVEIIGENPKISMVMEHYFNNDTLIINKHRKNYYIAWSSPLKSINMREFVCPPQ